MDYYTYCCAIYQYLVNECELLNDGYREVQDGHYEVPSFIDVLNGARELHFNAPRMTRYYRPL
jgi:hypothetical protein